MLELIQAIDATVLQLMLSIQSSTLTTIMQCITFIGNPILWFIFAALFYWLGEENEGFYLTMLVLLSSAVSGIFKTIIARPRPELIQGNNAIDLLVSGYNTYSFPSGHSTMISSVFTYLYNELKKKTKIIFALLIIAVMFSRLYLGKHYLSDVIAGLLLGLIIGVIAQEIKKRYADKKFNWLDSKILTITTLIAILIILLLIARNESIALVFLSYFIGFLLFKRFNLSIEKTKSIKDLITRLTIGLLVLIVLGTITTIYDGLITNTALFLIGLWISLLYPVLIIKANKRKDLNKSLHSKI